MSRCSFFIRVLKLGNFELKKRGLGIGDHIVVFALLGMQSRAPRVKDDSIITRAAVIAMNHKKIYS